MNKAARFGVPKKMSLQDKEKLRRYCRHRLNNFQEYFDQQYDDFLENLLCDVSMPIDIDKKSLYATDLQHVCSNVLIELTSSNSCIEFDPSLKSCEHRFKDAFMKGLETAYTFQKLRLDDVLPSSQPFNFESLLPQIDKLISLTDEFLSESFLSLIAVQFYLQSFEHLLLFDEKKLLEDETLLLMNDNNFDPLEAEINSLSNDARYLSQLEDYVYMGLFKVDIRSVVTLMKTRINKAIKECFENAILVKFQKMLEDNEELYKTTKNNLSASISSVEAYIEMKTLLQSRELKESVDNIQSDIKLCRKINDFLETHLQHTELLIIKYLGSLNWVSVLNMMQADARRRLQESGPKFVLELKRESEQILEELAMLQKETKKFEAYADLHFAEEYYSKADDANKKLAELQERAVQVNKRQDVLECKETNFEVIGAEVKNFEKYFNLWDFIAARWSPNVNLWWKGPFHDIKHYEMKSTLNYGNDLLKRLLDEFSSPNDTAIQEIIKSKQREVAQHIEIHSNIEILKHPSFKDRHWEAFFAEVKEQDKGGSSQQGKIDLHKITLTDLMNMHLVSHKAFLKQMLVKAQNEANTEQKIKLLKEEIKKIPIKPRIFDTDNIGLQIIPNVAAILSRLYEKLSTIQTMLSDPDYPTEFKVELKGMERMVRFAIDVFENVSRIQSQLMRFSPIFRYHSLNKYIKQESLAKFRTHRQDFQEIMKNIFQKEMAYFAAILSENEDSGAPDELIRKLVELKSSCEKIYELLKHFFKQVREECPRYYFFTDEQMTMLCSLLKFPKSLFGLIANLFKDIHQIDITVHTDTSELEKVDINSIRIKGGEFIKFAQPFTIDLSSTASIPLTTIVSELETAISDYFSTTRESHLLPIACFNFDFSDTFQYVKQQGIIFQHTRLFCQLVLDYEIFSIFRSSMSAGTSVNPYECLKNVKSMIVRCFATFFHHPSRYIDSSFADKSAILYMDSYIMMIRHFECIVDMLVKKDVCDFNAFDFQVMPKYAVDVGYDVVQGLKAEGMGSVEGIEGKLLEHTNREQKNQYADGVISASTSPVFKHLYCNKACKVMLNTLNYSIEHRSELRGGLQQTVYLPLTDGAAFALVSSAVNNKFVMLTGASGIGKNTSIRALSQLAGNVLYEFDCSLNSSVANVPAFFAGLLKGGYWVTFKNLEHCSNQLLSVICTQVEMIKSTLTGSPVVMSDGTSIQASQGYCVFTTCNIDSMTSRHVDYHHQSNPTHISLLEQFRIVNMHQPDFNAIISTLVAPAMVYNHAIAWSSRLLLFAKLIVQLDLNYDANKDLSTTIQGLQLKTLCSMIRSSIDKLYIYIASQYDQYRDKGDAKKYRLNINQLEIIAHGKRRGVFTRLFIEEVTNYFYCAELSSARIRGCHELLCDIFKDEIESVSSHDKASLLPQPEKRVKDKILESVKEYKEMYRDLSLPNSSKVYARIEEFMYTLYDTRSDSNSHFLVYGQPNTQKSTLIKLISYIYSNLLNINFKKYWITLEAMKHQYLFGAEAFDGVLKEIFYQCHNLDLEDKSSQPKKINYLFQSNCELFNVWADNRDPKRQGAVKDSSRGHSWLIFDGNTGKNSRQTSQTVSEIVSMFNTLHSPNEINHYIGFSKDMRIFYELNTISMLEPRVTTEVKMFYMEAPMVTLRERTEIWIDNLRRKDAFFGVMAERVVLLVDAIAIAFIAKLETRSNTDKGSTWLLYASNQLSMLNSFLNLFEMLLNEFRKYHSCHDLELLKNNAPLIASAKIDMANAGKTAGAPRQATFLNPQMKLAQEAQGFNMINARSRPTPLNAGNSPAQNYLTGIDKPEDIVEMENRRLEGMAVFSVIYSLYGHVFESKRSMANKILGDIIHGYSKKAKIPRTTFANNFVGISEQSRYHCVTDYYFDVFKGSWMKWTDYKIRSHSDISADFSLNMFSRVELDRIGCQNVNLLAQTDIPEGPPTGQQFVQIFERSVVETPEYSMLNYFLEHFVAYEKHAVLISEHQQGKTLMVNTILRRVIEQQKIVAFNFQLQGRSDPEVIQRHVEANLVKAAGNMRKPPSGKTAVVWLDDLHMSISDSKIESLVRCLQTQQGWFSYHSKTFISIEHTIFLMSMSLRESEMLAARESINAVNVDVMAKCSLLKLRKINQEEFKSIFTEVVQSTLASTPTGANKADDGLPSAVFKQLVAVLYVNLDLIRQQMSYRPVSLGMDYFYNIAKLFNQVSWKAASRNKANLPFSIYYLLQDIVRSDIGLTMIELKMVADHRRDTRIVIDLAMPSTNMPMPASTKIESKRLQLNLFADGAARPGSAYNRPRVDDIKQEHTVGKRGRTISVSLEPSDDDLDTVKKISKFGQEGQAKLSRFGQQSSMSPNVKFDSKNRQVSSKSQSNSFEDSDSSSQESEKSISKKSSRSESRASKSQSQSNQGELNSMMPSQNISHPAKMSRFYKATKVDPSSPPSPSGSVKAASQRKIDLLQVNPSNLMNRRNSNAMSTLSGARSVNRPLAVYDAEQKEDSSQSLSSSDESEEYKLLDPNNLNPANAKKMREMNKKKAMADAASGKSSDPSKEDSGIGSKGKNNLKVIYPSMSSFSSSFEDMPKVVSKYAVNEQNPIQFFDKLLAKMSVKSDKISVYDQAKHEVHLKRRLVFDYAIQDHQDKDELERDYNLIQPSFEVLDAKKRTKITRFIKQSLETYIFHTPEALAAFPLDKNNLPRFMDDFSALHLTLRTDCQHMIISTVKASLYAKHLVAFICEVMSEGFYYFDLMLDDSLDKSPTDVTQDTYSCIKECIKDNFDKMIKNNRRIVIMINVGSIRRNDAKQLLSRVIDLVCAVAFNTDMVLDHFCEQIHEFVAQIKKERTFNHYDDYFAGYIVRNKLESKVSFLIVHENEQSEIYRSKTRMKSPDNSDDFLRYLSQQFPKFSSRAKNIVINGLRCGSDYESDLYEPVLLKEPWLPSRVFNASASLELAYLKNLDIDMDHFAGLRPIHDSVVLYNFVKIGLIKKFSGKHSLADDEAVVHEQKQLLAKIQRRIDISAKDAKALGEQILMKELHIQQISANTAEMDSSYASTKDKKHHYFKLRTQLDKEMNAIRYEEENFKKICKDLAEAQETILSLQNDEFRQSLSAGIFLSSHTFTMYSVLFHELFRRSPLPEVSLADLERLSVTSATNVQYGQHSTTLIKLIDDMPTFKNIVKDIKDGGLILEPDAARLQAMYKVISNTENSLFTKFQADQQLFMLWIDLLIESTVLRRSRPEREANLSIILLDVKKLQNGIDECDRVIQGFDSLLKERQELKVKLESDIKELNDGKAEKDRSILTLSNFQDELINVQKTYLQTMSPFIAYNLDKDTIVEIIASFVVFWNKYPYQVKRSLFYNLLKSLNMDLELFNDIQIYDFLSSEPQLVSAVKSKVPFNLNMLNNAAVLQFIQEAGLPFPVVRDPSGLFVKYLHHRYERFLTVDMIVPSSKTIDDIEASIENGQPYVVVDPSDELLRVVKPLVEWRFKRYCEHVLMAADCPVNSSYSTIFKGKNVIVKEGFRVIIVLQKNRPEMLDPALLAQCMYVNNDFGEKKIWNETLTEELIICLEEASRNDYVQGFLESDLQGKIYERYKQLSHLLATFDFMNSSVEAASFAQIQRLLSEVKVLVLSQEDNIRLKKENLLKAKLVTQSKQQSSAELDLSAAGFMNNHYAISVPGYFKLYSKYTNLSDKLRVYQAANEKFKAYVGDDLCINQELFMYMFKECIQAYRKELQEIFGQDEQPDRSPGDESSDEIRPIQRKEVTADQLEGLFSKIEKTFFNQIINSIPYSCRYIYSFLCGLTHTLSHSDSDKRSVLKKVNLMLFSEKIMPSQSRNLSFVSRNLYDKFNSLFRSLNLHFQYSSSNLPENCSLMDEFDQRLGEVKTLEDLKANFRLNMFAMDGQEKGRKDKNSVLAISALIAGEKSKQSQSVKTMSMAEKSSAQRSSKAGDKSEHSEDDKIEDKITRVLVRQETINDHGNSILEEGADEEVKKPVKLTHFQRPADRKLTRMTSVDLFVDSQGNFVAEDEYNANKKTNTLKDDAPTMKPVISRQLGQLDRGLRIEERSSEDISPLRVSSNRLESFGQRSGELSPTRSRHSVQTLISATRSIIERNKQARLNYERRFIEQFMEFIGKLMNVISKVDKDKIMSQSANAWHQFMTFSKSGLLMDSGRSCLPKSPIDTEVIEELGSIHMLTFFKYSRPDLMHYLLETFYADIRGQAYFRHHLDLGLFAKIEAFSKPIVLIYGQTHRSPYASLQRIADSMDITLYLMRLEVNYHLPTIHEHLDALSTKPIWVVLENIELMSRKSSFVLMRAMANFMAKQRKGSKFKIWALYHIPELSASHLVVHQNWPDWMSFCYRVHMDVSKSIKEEMISLHWREIYQLSANTRGLLVADASKSSAILMRSRSFLLPPLDSDLPMGDSDKTIKLPTEPGNSPSERSVTSPSFNLIQDITTRSRSNTEITDYKRKFKGKLTYCLKFMWSVFRQRSRYLGLLLNSQTTASLINKSDAEIEALFEDMTDLYEEPLLFVYNYLSCCTLPSKDLSNVFSSRLSLKVFIETYMVNNLEGALSLKIEKEHYVLPKIDSFDNFKDAFQEGIITLPALDNPKIMGLRNNEEIMANYELSNQCFKLLSSYFHEAKFDELDDRFLSKSQTSEFQSLIKKSTQELEALSISSYIEYAISVVNKYEQTVGFSRESATVMLEIIDAFSEKHFEQMAASLTDMANHSLPGGQTPGRSSKGNLPMYLKYSDPEIMSVKSGERFTPSYKEKEDSVSLKSNEKSKNKVVVFKNQFSKSFLSNEFRTLKTIAGRVVKDLSIARMNLLGEPIYRLGSTAQDVLQSFYLNEVPRSWKSLITTKNLKQETFTIFIKSLLTKFDQIYSLTVKLKGELPPIIPVNRLLDPESFFVNVLSMNARLRSLAINKCSFTLRSCRDKAYRESTSTIKIAGLSIRGGRIDPVSSELVDESPREYSSPMDALFLEVIESDCTDLMVEKDNYHAAFFMKSLKVNHERSIRAEFYKALDKELNNPSSLFTKGRQDSPSQNIKSMKRDITNRLRKQLTMEIQSESVKFPVRLPVYLTESRSTNPVSRTDFYLYCYSSMPQIHWINKGAFVKLTDN